MRRFICLYLALFCGLIAAWQAVAQITLTGAGSPGKIAVTAVPFVDGAAVNGDFVSGGSFVLPAMSSSNGNVVIYVVLLTNGSTVGNLSVTDTAGNTYTLRVTTAGTNNLNTFTAKSASSLSGNVITLHDSGTNWTFATATAFAVAGTNFASPFDPNGANPSANLLSSITWATTNNNTIAISAARGAASYTPDAGFTSLSNRNFMLVEYQHFNSAQGSITANGGTSGSNGMIADALTN